MIQHSLSYATNALNQYMVNKFNADERLVNLNNIVEPGGSIPESNKNKLVVSLINIEKESSRQFYQNNNKTAKGSFARGNNVERYNLSILLSANFDDYQESLKFLNAGILFFQTYPVLDKSNFASLPDDIQKLEFDMDKIDYHQIHSLWTSLGAKYQPSVIYKMWLISLQSDRVEAFIPAVKETSNRVTP